MVTRRKDRAQGQYRVRMAIGNIKHDKSFSRLEDAQRFEAKLVREKELIRAGLPLPQELVPIYDFSITYMAKRKLQIDSHDITLPTYLADEKNIRLYVLPFMATRMLQTTTTAEWKALFDFIQAKFSLSNATVNRVRSTVHGMYAEAVAIETANFNPITAVKPKDEKKKKRAKVFWETEGECLSYLEGASRKLPGFELAAHIFINTGARVSEVCALRVCDVELDHEIKGGTLHLERILEQASGKIKPRTKSGHMRDRYIPVTEALYERLLARLTSNKCTAPTDFLCHDNGSMLHPDRILKIHFDVIEEQKLKRITVHELRTTFASIQRSKGVSMDDVKDVLGHSSTVVTQIYAKTTKTMMKTRPIKGVGFAKPTTEKVVPLRGEK